MNLEFSGSKTKREWPFSWPFAQFRSIPAILREAGMSLGRGAARRCQAIRTAPDHEELHGWVAPLRVRPTRRSPSTRRVGSEVLTSRAEAGNSREPIFLDFADDSDAGPLVLMLHRICSATSTPASGFMESCPPTVRLDCRQSPQTSFFVKLNWFTRSHDCLPRPGRLRLSARSFIAAMRTATPIST